MALSYSKYKSTGTELTFPITFPYISQEHVHIKIDAKDYTAFTIDPVNHTVTLQEPALKDVVVFVYRFTPRDRPYSDFSRGNQFGQMNVNNSFLWQLYISQEIYEGRWSEELVITEHLNMNGYRVVNMGEPIDPADATTKKYVDDKWEASLQYVTGQASTARDHATQADLARNAAMEFASQAETSANAAKASADAAKQSETSAAASAEAAANSATEAAQSAEYAKESEETIKEDLAEVERLVQGIEGATGAKWYVHKILESPTDTINVGIEAKMCDVWIDGAFQYPDSYRIIPTADPTKGSDLKFDAVQPAGASIHVGVYTMSEIIKVMSFKGDILLADLLKIKNPEINDFYMLLDDGTLPSGKEVVAGDGIGWGRVSIDAIGKPTYGWTSAGNWRGPQGIQGPVGPKGDDGILGGDGKSILPQGEITCEALSELFLGEDQTGFMWILTNSGSSWGVAFNEGDGAWWSGKNMVNMGHIVGPQGLKGDKGDTGQDGMDGTGSRYVSAQRISVINVASYELPAGHRLNPRPEDVVVAIGGVLQTPQLSYVIEDRNVKFLEIPPAGLHILIKCIEGEAE